MVAAVDEITLNPIRIDDAKVVIFSTDRLLREEEVQRLRAQWETLMEGVENPPKMVIATGMQVTVIGRDSE